MDHIQSETSFVNKVLLRHHHAHSSRQCLQLLYHYSESMQQTVTSSILYISSSGLIWNIVIISQLMWNKLILIPTSVDQDLLYNICSITYRSNEQKKAITFWVGWWNISIRSYELSRKFGGPICLTPPLFSFQVDLAPASSPSSIKVFSLTERWYARDTRTSRRLVCFVFGSLTQVYLGEA